MRFVTSLRRRLAASEPCCLVCGKRLKLADAQSVPVFDRFSVLACHAHAGLLSGTIGLGTIGAKHLVDWVKSRRSA